MRSKRVRASLLGVEQVVVESVRFEPFVSADGMLGEGGRGDGVLRQQCPSQPLLWAPYIHLCL